MGVAARSLAGWALGLALAGCSETSAPSPPPSDEPIDLSAAWSVTSPGAEGIDAAGLATALSHGSAIPGLRSVIVIRHGHLVAERYFAGAPPDSLYALRSVTKSVMSLLIGIAIERGLVRSTDQPLSELFVPPLPSLDAADGAITIGDLLTMTGGFQWNETGVTEYNNWVLAPDQIEYLLARPIVSPPGTTFNYNSAAVHLLSAVLQVHAGGTAAFADTYLLRPLGIEARDWELDNRGIPNGGAGLYLHPRDIAKLGQLVLQRGRSGTSVIIPQGWIDQSTRQQGSPHGFLGQVGSLEYGNLWWLGVSAGHEIILGWGYGGQLLYIVPGLDLVVATTSTWQGLGSAANDQTTRIADLIVGEIAPTAH